MPSKHVNDVWQRIDRSFPDGLQDPSPHAQHQWRKFCNKFDSLVFLHSVWMVVLLPLALSMYAMFVALVLYAVHGKFLVAFYLSLGYACGCLLACGLSDETFASAMEKLCEATSSSSSYPFRISWYTVVTHGEPDYVFGEGTRPTTTTHSMTIFFDDTTHRQDLEKNTTTRELKNSIPKDIDEETIPAGFDASSATTSTDTAGNSSISAGSCHSEEEEVSGV